MICDQSSVEQINKERCQMVLSPPIPCHSIKLLYLDFPLPNFDFLHPKTEEGQKVAKQLCLFATEDQGFLSHLASASFCRNFGELYNSACTVCTGQKRMRTET